MAAKKETEEIVLNDGLTFQMEEKKEENREPMVTIYLPALEDSGSAGLKVDQYEHVTIANEQQEKCYKVLRGEPVQVPVSVFVVLKEKYPKL